MDADDKVMVEVLTREQPPHSTAGTCSGYVLRGNPKVGCGILVSAQIIGKPTAKNLSFFTTPSRFA